MPQTSADKLLQLQKEYQLPARQNEQIFRKYILPQYKNLEQQTSVSPQATILGGQPGSGKSTLMHLTKSERNGDNEKIGLAADDYRHFHPEYNFFLKEFPEFAQLIVSPDAAIWSDKLMTKCMLKKQGLVIEGAMGNAA